MVDKFLKKTGIIATIITIGLFSFWLSFSQICLGGYLGGPKNGIDIGENSRAINRINLQVGTGSVFVMRFGTTTVTGSGSTGFMNGTDTAYPREVWTPADSTLNFLDMTLQRNGVAIPAFIDSAGLSTAINDETGTNTVVFSSGSTQTNTTFTGNSNFPFGIWNSTGRIGAGTSTPSALLHIQGAQTTYSGLNDIISVFKGTTNTNSFLAVDAPSGYSAGFRFFINSVSKGSIGVEPTDSRMSFYVNDGSYHEGISIKSNGNVGFGTSTPSAQFHTTGTVRFASLGAGTVQSDASGNLSVSSDERLKDIQGAFSQGLAGIIGISPIQFHYNKLSGLDMENVYTGFSAQNVLKSIPEAISIDSNGYLGINDRTILAVVVNAIKELHVEIDTLKQMNNILLIKYETSLVSSLDKCAKTKLVTIKETPVLAGEETHEYIESKETESQEVKLVYSLKEGFRFDKDKGIFMRQETDAEANARRNKTMAGLINLN